MFIEKIYQLEKEKKYVSVYSNSQELTKFIFGKIVGCNENHVVIAAYTPHGLYDGIILIETECICKIEYDNLYAAKMIKLIGLNKKNHDDYAFKDDLLMSVLKYSMQKEYFMTLELLNSGYDDAIGIVESLAQEYFTIQSVDEYGTLNGSVSVRYSDVTKLSVNSIDEMYLKEIVR